MYMDREYALLELLSENEEVGQRKLAKLLDISLGSVNMLLNKMQREGLIKMKNITTKSVAYMLTPEGITAKANKTYRYITYHYKRINETKEKIQQYLEEKAEEEEKIYLVLDDSEMSEIVRMAVSGVKNSDRIEVFNGNNAICAKDSLYLLLRDEDKENFTSYRIEILLESL